MSVSKFIGRICVATLLSLAGAGMTHAAACKEEGILSATTPQEYTKPHMVRKAENLLGDVPSKADTILLGDSLLERWPADQVQQQFGDKQVWNFAIGGSRTEHILWLMNELGPSSLKPKEVIVLIGTNNLSQKKLQPCAIIAGIEKVVMEARNKWPSAALRVMGIPPRGPAFHFRDKGRLSINENIKFWIAEVPNARYFEVDNQTITCGLYQKDVENITDCQNYADDFGHFERPGYDVIYNALRKSQ